MDVQNKDKKMIKERLMPRAIRQMKACDERCGNEEEKSWLEDYNNSLQGRVPLSGVNFF